MAVTNSELNTAATYTCQGFKVSVSYLGWSIKIGRSPSPGQEINRAPPGGVKETRNGAAVRSSKV